MSGLKRKFNVGTSSEDEIVAGPSTSTKEEDLEGESDNETSEEELDDKESKDEPKVTPRGKFYLSLAKLTKKQFEDKEFFNKLVEAENARSKATERGKMKRPLDRTSFHWRDGQIKVKYGKTWRTMSHVASKTTKQTERREEEGRHQTYLAITIPQKDIEGKSLKEIWEYCREKVKRRGHYVGETFAVEFGVRVGHFAKSKQSPIKTEMVDNDSRCFQIAVIITESEEERKSLEEFIIYFLMEQEENDPTQKLLNQSIQKFLISPDLRKKQESWPEVEHRW